MKLALLIACALASGCKIRKRTPFDARIADAPLLERTGLDARPLGTPGQLAALRADVLATITPLAGRAEYAGTDPATLDDCITSALFVLGARMPTTSERARTIAYARTCVDTKLLAGAGLGDLIERVELRYHHPVITRTGEVVRIDAGVVAGVLTGDHGHLELAHSCHLGGPGTWKTSEIVRYLQLGVSAYPDARRYEAVVSMLTDPPSTFVFDRRPDHGGVPAPSPGRYVETLMPPSSLSAPLAQLLTEALSTLEPYDDRPEYAVTDPDVFVSCLPTATPAPSERARAVQVTSSCAWRQLREPGGLTALEERIELRYHHPVITRAGDLVRIKAGLVAGQRTVSKRGIYLHASPHLDNGEWKASEVVRYLRLGIAQHPTARTYLAEVEVDTGYGYPEWTYVYDRSDDRLRVYPQYAVGASSVTSYVTAKLGGDLGRVTSVSTSVLAREDTDNVPVR